MILPTFDIQGHRGARGLKPENTLPSFEAALDAGATSLECDVHLTAEGVPVLCHDPQLHGGLCRRVDGAAITEPLDISGLTLSHLKEYIADRNPDPARFNVQSADETPLARWLASERAECYAIPTLAELFRFVNAYAGELGQQAGKTDVQRSNARQVIVDVELKAAPFRNVWLTSTYAPVCPWFIEHEVLSVMRAEWSLERARVRSFDHRIVKFLREREPSVVGVVLIEGTAPVDPVALAKAAGATVYAPDVEFLDQDQVEQCHSAGIAVIPWTVNYWPDWQRLVASGVDGITTDYPNRLAKWMRSEQRH